MRKMIWFMFLLIAFIWIAIAVFWTGPNTPQKNYDFPAASPTVAPPEETPFVGATSTATDSATPSGRTNLNY